jgi:hypothetical protein
MEMGSGHSQHLPRRPSACWWWQRTWLRLQTNSPGVDGEGARRGAIEGCFGGEMYERGWEKQRRVCPGRI